MANDGGAAFAAKKKAEKAEFEQTKLKREEFYKEALSKLEGLKSKQKKAERAAATTTATSVNATATAVAAAAAAAAAAAGLGMTLMAGGGDGDADGDADGGAEAIDTVMEAEGTSHSNDQQHRIYYI